PRLVLVFTSIVDTELLDLFATKRVLPSGVTAIPAGPSPTFMSVGYFVLVITSIADTVPPPLLATKAVGRHRDRAGTAAPLGLTPITAPPIPSTTTTRTDGDRRISAPCLAASPAHAGRPERAYGALGLCEREPDFCQAGERMSADQRPLTRRRQQRRIGRDLLLSRT